jgi:glutamate decarboxylase
MCEEELPATIAARFVHDELLMDGTPALNLASFVTTYMEDEAEKLMLENLSKNIIDVEDYPALDEIESRCVNMIARLFNAPLDNEHHEALGVSTILSLLAAKRRRQSEFSFLHTFFRLLTNHNH